MDSVSFHATTKLENKLSGIYEILYKKERKLAGNINRYTAQEKCSNVHRTLLIHIMCNLCIIAGLSYLLY